MRRSAIHHWQHLGTSTRRTAEVLRSWLGHQERWQIWRPLDPAPSDMLACHRSASTVERWLDQAGQTARQTRRTLTALVRGVYDAATDAEAQAALARLAAHELGAPLATLVAAHLEAARYYQCGCNQGLGRASPEWLWRDFRLRASHGRNHCAEPRLERAALLWAIYHTFEPARDWSERKRTYRHPGQAPLALAGLPPGDTCYLDALAI